MLYLCIVSNSVRFVPPYHFILFYFFGLVLHTKDKGRLVLTSQNFKAWIDLKHTFNGSKGKVNISIYCTKHLAK